MHNKTIGIQFKLIWKWHQHKVTIKSFSLYKNKKPCKNIKPSFVLIWKIFRYWQPLTTEGNIETIKNSWTIRTLEHWFLKPQLKSWKKLTSTFHVLFSTFTCKVNKARFQFEWGYPKENKIYQKKLKYSKKNTFFFPFF